MVKAIVLALSMVLAFPATPSLDNVTRVEPVVRKEPQKVVNVVKKIDNVKVTGYYPLTCNKRERAVEGGKHDKFGDPIRVLQHAERHPYVTVAVDKKVIPLKSFFIIDEFPNIIFYASDVGKKIRGKKIDIAVLTKQNAHELPKTVAIKIINPAKMYMQKF